MLLGDSFGSDYGARAVDDFAIIDIHIPLKVWSLPLWNTKQSWHYLVARHQALHLYGDPNPNFDLILGLT